MKKIYLKPTVKITPIKLERVIATSTIDLGGRATQEGGMDSKDFEDFDDYDEDLW